MYLVPEDFVPLIQDIVDTHPGLGFLKEATEFHSRYVHTVSFIMQSPHIVYVVVVYIPDQHTQHQNIHALCVGRAILVDIDPRALKKNTF